MDDVKKNRLNQGLETFVRIVRQTRLTWAEHVEMSKVALELSELINGKDSSDEGTTDGGVASGK